MRALTATEVFSIMLVLMVLVGFTAYQWGYRRSEGYIALSQAMDRNTEAYQGLQKTFSQVALDCKIPKAQI